MSKLPSVSSNIKKIVDPKFSLDNETLKEVMVKFEREIKKGLKRSTHSSAETKCFVTFVQDLPNGTERGKFLALDLGGTNFRVLLIHLKGEEDYEFQSKIFAIPQNIMTGLGVELFDHIAKCLAEFAIEMNIQHEVLPLGFTFSFPCRQNGLTEGLLIKWTKGFNCKGVVNQNVVELLEDALKRRNDIKILICAILNDTTGTLMSCAWKHHDCKIGVILGTGSNACYLERTTNAELFEKQNKFDDEKVVINTEWGAFGDFGSLDFITTCYDKEVDHHSLNPGNQIFEKMLSGMYLGELVRLVLVHLTSQGHLFNGQISKQLSTQHQFFTKFVSEIETEAEDSINVVRKVLIDLGINEPSDEDCVNVRYVCESVTRRSAHLVATALATLILRMGDPDITIGVDGSVYRHHPKFDDLMTKKVKELIPSNYRFKFVLSEDGSGRGAALVAAVASRQVQYTNS
ncbi:CLUMA_CG017070, isoform A [Clunio marinus]|uniref:Phosphotransferase n=1 Tax=Clunio marinus TaxID=568069 RepID=A0A1J1IUQ5_9DIPT|nr:CLUMA_CG017070, isoform A [Clunio marinus]